jgi:hypothetical protein
MKTVCQAIASSVQARLNCLESKNEEWEIRHESAISELVMGYMPSGSGIDCGTKIDLERSTGDRLVFHAGFHHMNESGMYDGWTEHIITVRPAFSGFDIRISGRNRNDIKEYLNEVYSSALSETVKE